MSNKETGLVTFQGYQTKYKMGDEFWIMSNEKPERLYISKITITITADNIIPSYYLIFGNCHHYSSIGDARLDEMARTKEELAARVFGMNFNQE